MPALLSAVSWWVEMLQKPEQAAAFLTLVGGAVVGLIIKIVTGLNDARRKADMAAVPKEVAPMSHPAPLSPELLSRVTMLETVMTEWKTVDQARARVRELEAVEKMLRAEVERMRIDLEDATGDNVSLSRAVASANLRLEQVQRERDAAEQRAAVLADELSELKREITSGHHGSAAVTPMRPPPGKP